MVSVLCPRWWPYPLALSANMEALPGGPRMAEGVNTPPFTALFVMEARCIIYVAGQGSLRITDGVIMCNAALLHFLPIKNTFSI